MTSPTDPAPTAPSAPPGWWARLCRRHGLEGPSPALRAWLAIVVAGGGALAWSGSRLARLDPAELATALIGIALVAIAGSLALKIPRTDHSLTAAGLFGFAILAALGTPVAVAAAGIESAIGAWRRSKRLTTRLATPAATMAAVLVCGAAYTALAHALVGLGQPLLPASLIALCAVSLLPLLLTSMPLRALAALESGEPMRPREWLAESSWWAAIDLGAAFIAALAVANARRFGSEVLAIAAATALGMVLLLRVALRRQETERQLHESRVAAARREAELSRQRFTAAFTHAAIGMAITRRGGEVLQVNRALCTLLGRSDDDLVGKPFWAIMPEGDAALFRRRLHDDEPPGEPFSIELRCVAGDGSDLWVVLHCSRCEDPGSAEHCLIYQLHDITSRHIAESRLHHIAYHDSLTDLANRTCFHERLEVAVERSRLDAKERFAVLFLDLDRFKIVNDSLGHIAGNALLREVARRLHGCVRPADLVARLGGDEFAILLESLNEPDTGLRLAHRVIDAVGQPLTINGTELVPSASVGITFSDLGYRTVDEVLRDADLAMYAAKGNGRGRVARFDSSMHEKVAERLALEADLRRAIGEGQLSVHFQPLYELEPLRLCGFEALVRWVHPQRGPVAPEVFIALAEESGHIDAVTDWVIEYAVARLALWQRAAPAAGRLAMHVNISGRDLARASLVWHVQDVLSRHELAPQCLTLEITETTLMGRLEVALENINELRQIGVGFSIDDFGTGYSSLAYLSTLPIESLKIDRSFVIGLHDNPRNVEIVRAVQTLGRSLGRKIIAEGIETPEQLATLRQLGVPVGQGFLLSHPLPENQVEELLAIAEAATVF